MTDALREELIAKVKSLNELLWEHRVDEPTIRDWQSNFDGRELEVDLERLHALYLLTHLTYFGIREVRELLRCMYRDYVRAPILKAIHHEHPTLYTKDDFKPHLDGELERTRFIGMGNPAESGTHLLYYFRQEAALRKDLFVHHHQLFDGDPSSKETRLSNQSLKRIVFVDDICGSGQQSVSYSRNVLPQIRQIARRSGIDLEVSYLVLLGSRTGIEYARTHSNFDRIECISEMDETFVTYSEESRVFASAPDGITRAESLLFALRYGRELDSTNPLGYGNGQLLLAFHHNVPDNTLPIIWKEGGAQRWKALMKRADKIYV